MGNVPRSVSQSRKLKDRMYSICSLFIKIPIIEHDDKCTIKLKSAEEIPINKDDVSPAVEGRDKMPASHCEKLKDAENESRVTSTIEQTFQSSNSRDDTSNLPPLISDTEKLTSQNENI